MTQKHPHILTLPTHVALPTFVLAACVSAAVAATTRPNILWISTEDISPDLGCYGDAEATTPTLDRFAAEGARFARAFSIAGVCAPSRSAIITGMYPTTIGTHHMRSQGVPPAYVKCFTEHLRAAGYYCSNNVKTDYNFDAPATAWDESSQKAHWRNRGPDQPFFAVMNITTTHESRIRAPEAQFAKLTARLTADDRHDPADAKLPPYYPDAAETRNDWARYYDLITAMDYQVADILKELSDDGLADDTVVFFFGDHGRGLPRAKRWIYDSGLRIPLMIRWPGRIKPNTVRDDLVSFIDFAPTLLSLAGVKIPDYIQGQAFLGDQRAEPREFIFGARDRMDETYDIIRCVRDNRFKYIRNFQAEKPYAQFIDYMEKMPTMQVMRRFNEEGKLKGPQKLYFLPEKPQEELYDTETDPHEVHNLAGAPEHQKRLQQMRSVLAKWMDDTKDLGLIPEDELKERMRPGGEWAVTETPVLSPKPGTHSGPVTVQIQCSTEGASIAYTTSEADKPHWKLYTTPLTISETTQLRVKACRLGYKDSQTVRAEFKIASKSNG